MAYGYKSQAICSQATMRIYIEAIRNDTSVCLHNYYIFGMWYVNERLVANRPAAANLQEARER